MRCARLLPTNRRCLSRRLDGISRRSSSIIARYRAFKIDFQFFNHRLITLLLLYQISAVRLNLAGDAKDSFDEALRLRGRIGEIEVLDGELEDERLFRVECE